MRVLVQRSGGSSVSVKDQSVGQIDGGLVLFVGFCEGDNLEKIEYLVHRILNLRIFPDQNGVMNQSILEFGGDDLSHNLLCMLIRKRVIDLVIRTL